MHQESVVVSNGAAPPPPSQPRQRDRREPEHRNEILVAGRITAEPLIRELPSGDRLATWRVCVVRPSDSRYGAHRSDSITCASFDRVLHEEVRTWRLGDVVRMTGELRRRTWRVREGVRSVCEVEARTATLVRAVGRRSPEEVDR
ncbi:single-stranded DNA-binding protein [Nocardiopsis halotolerans]|uniref:single-stranded DNA-binding protein n=1 Tax=Nocardiopsis halotolerans TaxID=124252 RepID=UPI00034C8C0C|nr:single-stranded DNA-binding protein [Nocardiopsis halotolerans]